MKIETNRKFVGKHTSLTDKHLRWNKFFVLLLFLTPLSHAQEDDFGVMEVPDIRGIDQEQLSSLSPDVREIRQAQLQLAQDGNAAIEIIELEGKSRTNIHEVPDTLANWVIASENDATEFIRELYPYYGFRGTESLRLNYVGERVPYTIYGFRQYINGIQTSTTVRILVDNDTDTIDRLVGGALIDRDYPRTPQLSEEDAIAAAIELAREKDEDNMAMGRNLLYRLDGIDIYTEIEEYVSSEGGALEPTWTVYIPLLEPWEEEGITHWPFRVNPDGRAIDPYRGIDIDTARVCEGSAGQSAFCTGTGGPLVVYSDGTCAPGSNCTGAQEFHKRAWDKVMEVQEMWEDIVGPGCCDIGDTNSGKGDHIDINVGYPISTTGKYQPTGSNIAAIILNQSHIGNDYDLLGQVITQGSTPFLRTLQRSLIMGKRSVYVKAKKIQPRVQAGRR